LVGNGGGMTVRVYRSTDANAPTCTGEVGKLIAILDACLVNGITLPSITSITRSGSIATITFSSAHNMVSFFNWVTLSGLDQSEYNGEFLFTVVSTTVCTFTVSGTPATPATGTATAKKTGSGWTKSFSGTNLAAYKQPAGNGFYLRVDDTGTTDARVVGYEVMTDINTGTGDFPTAAQLAGGAYLRKSSAASTTVRAWILIATQKGFYLWVDQAGAVTSAQLNFFGDLDITGYKSTDAFHTAILVNGSAAGTTGVHNTVVSIATAIAGNYLTRSYTNTGTAVAAGKSIDAAGSKGTASIGAAGEAYPSNVSGGLLYSDVIIHESAAAARRGRLPGILAPLHAVPLTHLDTFSGSGAYTGNKYLALSHSATGQSFIEISNTW
jgi:hypothetical protein